MQLPAFKFVFASLCWDLLWVVVVHQVSSPVRCSLHARFTTELFSLNYRSRKVIVFKSSNCDWFFLSACLSWVQIKSIYFTFNFSGEKLKCDFDNVPNIPKPLKSLLSSHIVCRSIYFLFFLSTNMVTVERFAYHLRVANMACVEISTNDKNALLAIYRRVHAINLKVGFFFFLSCVFFW